MLSEATHYRVRRAAAELQLSHASDATSTPIEQSKRILAAVLGRYGTLPHRVMYETAPSLRYSLGKAELRGIIPCSAEDMLEAASNSKAVGESGMLSVQCIHTLLRKLGAGMASPTKRLVMERAVIRIFNLHSSSSLAMAFTRSGCVDFLNFASSLSLLCTNTPDQTLDSLFALWDCQYAGYIKFSHIVECLHSLLLVECDYRPTSETTRCRMKHAELAETTVRTAFAAAMLPENDGMTIGDFKQAMLFAVQSFEK